MKNAEQPQTLTLTVEKPLYGGMSLARHEGKVVLISDMLLAGERAVVTVTEEKKDFIRADVASMLSLSPDRTAPPCRYYGACGGCQMQHFPYPMQVKVKEEILCDSLRRIGRIDPVLADPLLGDSPMNYRVRGQFKVSGSKVGFYRKGSRDVVDVENCPLMAESVNACLARVRQVITQFPVREVHLTCSSTCVGLVILDSRKPLKSIQTLASAILNSGLEGLSIQAAGRKTAHHGTPFTTLDMGTMVYTVSSESFVQSNWGLNRKVISTLRGLSNQKGKTIIDLYAGGGNFSLALAKEADVIAVEENAVSVRDGIRNARLNNISTCRFVRSSAERYTADRDVGLVIVDPPRPGLTKKAMETLLSLLPKTVLYISCNPATLARDLKKMHATYHIESIRLIDFFPQTWHLESLAVLRRKSSLH